ncbi:MAG: TlpA disulfide reductase family protein [Blastocatellia bacterium]
MATELATNTTAKRHRTTIVYSVCIILLLFSNGFLLLKHARLRNEVKEKGSPTKAQAIDAVMSMPFRTSNGDSVTLADTKSGYVVLFVFTHSDCAACLEEVTTLNRIREVRPDMRVYGLMSNASPDEVRQTEQNFGISFPLLQDPTGEILNSLHLPKTPWKFVVSVAQKDIAYEDPPSMTEVEREAFLKRLGQLEVR